MICPRCVKTMKERSFGPVTVDVCEFGCDGIWFDWMELSKLDEKNEGLGAYLRDALISYPNKNVPENDLICPRCKIPLQPHKYKHSKSVVVDECYGCGAFFLEAGELKVIRESFMDNNSRDVFLNSVLNESPDYKKWTRNVERDKLRTEALKRMSSIFRVAFISLK